MKIVENYVVVEVVADDFEIDFVFVITASVVTVVDDAVKIVEDYAVDGADADALEFEIVVVKSATVDIVVGAEEITEDVVVVGLGIVFEKSVFEEIVVGAEEIDEHFVVADVFETDSRFLKSVFAKTV